MNTALLRELTHALPENSPLLKEVKKELYIQTCAESVNVNEDERSMAIYNMIHSILETSPDKPLSHYTIKEKMYREYNRCISPTGLANVVRAIKGDIAITKINGSNYYIIVPENL